MSSTPATTGNDEEEQLLDMAADINETAILEKCSKTTTTAGSGDATATASGSRATITATSASTSTGTAAAAAAAAEQHEVLDMAANMHETDKLQKYSQQQQEQEQTTNSAGPVPNNVTVTGSSGIHNVGIRDIVTGADHHHNRDSAAVPLPLPGLRRDVVRRQQLAQPGAYSSTNTGGNQTTLERHTTLDYNLVGVNSADDNGPALLVTHSNSTPTTSRHNNTNRVLDDSQLAVANPVTEYQQAPADLMHANPVDLEAAAAQREQDHKKEQKIVIVISIWGLCLVAIILGFVVAAMNKNKDKETKVDDAADTPTTFGSMIPSQVPSSAPTAVLGSLLNSLPISTLANINNGSHVPQWKAWNWLNNHENVTFLPEWRKEQLFVLATFFYSMNGENWWKPIQERWMDETTNECDWFSNGMGSFITAPGFSYYPPENQYPPCNDVGHFKHLHLAHLFTESNGIIGEFNNKLSIPPEVRLLTSLDFVQLTGDDIEAVLSKFLPAEFYQMSTIRYLGLQINHLLGTIPTELGIMTQLTHLFLAHNSISGTIPTELALLTNLEYLWLAPNKLTGSLPSHLWLMTSLTNLGLYNGDHYLFSFPKNGTTFTGQLSTEIGKLNNLIQLEIGGNQFTGSLPSELGLLTSVTLLAVNQNLLTGPIPKMMNIYSIYLNSNLFTGTLPISEFQSNSNLLTLILGGNIFSGTIPTELGRLTSLWNLDLSSLSLLTGPLPSEIGLLTGLQVLHIRGSSLSGTIPTEVGLLTGLIWLDLGDNNLTGVLPSQLDESMGLRLDGNQFSGTVPEHLCSTLGCDCSTNVTLASSCFGLSTMNFSWLK